MHACMHACMYVCTYVIPVYVCKYVLRAACCVLLVWLAWQQLCAGCLACCVLPVWLACCVLRAACVACMLCAVWLACCVLPVWLACCVHGSRARDSKEITLTTSSFQLLREHRNRCARSRRSTRHRASSCLTYHVGVERTLQCAVHE
jgi:hypothetical protein